MPRTKLYDENRVLESAMHLFWENGYEATFVRMLEKKMEINQFSIYSSFENKKKLFIRSIKNYQEYVKTNVISELLKENAGLAELEKFLYHAANSGITNKKKIGCLVVNTTAELGNSDNEIAVELANYYDFINGILQNLLQNAIDKKEISAFTNIEQQANFFLGVLQSISVASKTSHHNQLNDFIKISIHQIKL